MAKRKLIEAAIPLDAINAACKADKDRKTGTMRNLHKWFAPMPLPAWRALLFAALVDDPGDPEERDRLLRLVEDLMASGGDPPGERELRAARQAIAEAWPDGVPTVLDPFCGAGSTLVEAQRLGCSTVGSDLNPVPVLISKFLTELLPATPAEPPTALSGPLVADENRFGGFEAVAAHYARVVEQRVFGQLGRYYQLEDGAESVAWLWARTARCPNPACGCVAPLLSTTWLSKKKGAERSLVIEYDGVEPRFAVAAGPPETDGTVRRGNGRCSCCGSTIPVRYLRDQGVAGRLGQVMTAVVTETNDGREYRAASDYDRALAADVPELDDPPAVPLVGKATQNLALYGIRTQADLYTPRALRLLDTFATEVAEIGAQVEADGGDEATAQAVPAFLALCVGKLAQNASQLSMWAFRDGPSRTISAFGRHDMPMNWDWPEPSPFSEAGPSWMQLSRTAARACRFAIRGANGVVEQADARQRADGMRGVLVATDPPYFDQIGYADLADFFYVWHRRALRREMPSIYATMATPKEEELVALPWRHGTDRDAAARYFIDGFTDVFRTLSRAQHDELPMLIVYASREQGADGDAGVTSRGWAAILEAVIAGGLRIVGTWPIHGTTGIRMMSAGSNALATYVVLVCRPRSDEAPRITRSEFARLLRTALGDAVAELQHANVAPVDLAQAVIGPGMKVYSSHSRVIQTDGTRVGVIDALSLINRTLAEVLDEQEGDLDSDSRWAVTWYDDNGFDTAAFGKADQLARAKGIAVDSLVQAGIVTSGGNKVALLTRDRLDERWDPATDRRATAWEAVQYLVRALDEGGERAAAELYARLGGLADPARELAYRLFQIAEKKGRTDEAIAYNGLVTSWSEIARLADDIPRRPTPPTAEALF